MFTVLDIKERKDKAIAALSKIFIETGKFAPFQVKEFFPGDIGQKRTMPRMVTLLLALYNSMPYLLQDHRISAYTTPQIGVGTKRSLTIHAIIDDDVKVKSEERERLTGTLESYMEDMIDFTGGMVKLLIMPITLKYEIAAHAVVIIVDKETEFIEWYDLAGQSGVKNMLSMGIIETIYPVLQKYFVTTPMARYTNKYIQKEKSKTCVFHSQVAIWLRCYNDYPRTDAFLDIVGHSGHFCELLEVLIRTMQQNALECIQKVFPQNMDPSTQYHMTIGTANILAGLVLDCPGHGARFHVSVGLREYLRENNIYLPVVTAEELEVERRRRELLSVSQEPVQNTQREPPGNSETLAEDLYY